MAQRLALIVAPRYAGNQWLPLLEGTPLIKPRLVEVLDAYGHYDSIISDLTDVTVKRGQLRNRLINSSSRTVNCCCTSTATECFAA